MAGGTGENVFLSPRDPGPSRPQPSGQVWGQVLSAAGQGALLKGRPPSFVLRVKTGSLRESQTSRPRPRSARVLSLHFHPCGGVSQREGGWEDGS